MADRARGSLPDVDGLPQMTPAMGDQPSEVTRGVIMIPDISGYTSFVSTTELTHAQGIVSRLLAAIGCQEGWESWRVSKFVGDAVLLYAPQGDLKPDDLQARVLESIERTYRTFLEAREATDKAAHPCGCAACSGVSGLDLKFVLHYGEFLIHEILAFRELLGRDVILAFRLLKNSIDSDCYALLSDSFMALDREIESRLDQVTTESYAFLGEIRVGVLDPRKASR